MIASPTAANIPALLEKRVQFRPVTSGPHRAHLILMVVDPGRKIVDSVRDLAVREIGEHLSQDVTVRHAGSVLLANCICERANLIGQALDELDEFSRHGESHERVSKIMRLGWLSGPAGAELLPKKICPFQQKRNLRPKHGQIAPVHVQVQQITIRRIYQRDLEQRFAKRSFEQLSAAADHRSAGRHPPVTTEDCTGFRSQLHG